MAFQVYTEYTEVDTPDRLSIAGTKVDFTGLLGNDDDILLYKDKGVDHFSGDFTHLFECLKDTVDRFGIATVWAIVNIIDDYQGVVDNTEDGIFVLNSGPTNTTNQFIVRVVEGGSFTQDFTGSISESTLYFCTIDRDDDGGANNTGKYTLHIRTGSHTGTLIDTLTVDSSVGEQNDFRYIHAVSGTNNGQVAHIATGYVQNLDIQEVEDLPQPPSRKGLLLGVHQPSILTE